MVRHLCEHGADVNARDRVSDHDLLTGNTFVERGARDVL